jgi:predicted nucleic acid-binding protein
MVARGKAVRVYADTSVFGAIADAEFFSTPSLRFFEFVIRGDFKLVISPTLEFEIEAAPPPIKVHFSKFREIADVISAPEAIVDLRDAYLKHGVLTPRWDADALHVASATVAGCQIIVSWNFRHIVNYKKIRLFNAVNQLMGYDLIAIHTPQEVIQFEAD